MSVGRRLFALPTSTLPGFWRLRSSRTFSTTRSSMSTRNSPHSISYLAGKSVPFSDYGEVILVARIQEFLNSQAILERDLEGFEPGPTLGMAIEMQKVDVVRFLLNKGTDPNGWSCGHSIFHIAHAAGFKNQEILKLLLDHGAHPQKSGALWEAAEVGNIAAAEVLIDRGVDVDEIITSEIYADLDGEEHFPRLCQLQDFVEYTYQRTPLHAAAGKDQADMVKFLLSKGANKEIKDDGGYTAASTVTLNLFGLLEDYPESVANEKCRLKILDMLE